MQQYLITNHQSGKPFLMGAEIDLFFRASFVGIEAHIEAGNW